MFTLSINSVLVLFLMAHTAYFARSTLRSVSFRPTELRNTVLYKLKSCFCAMGASTRKAGTECCSCSLEMTGVMGSSNMKRIMWLSLLLVAGLVNGHEMGDDMGDDMRESDSVVEATNATTTSTTSSVSIVPTPFEPRHPHGIPILQRPGLTEAEKLYWNEYNTTTYFATDKGDRAALEYHAVSLVCSIVFLYPICLVLHSIKSSWYLLALLVNLAVIISSLFALSIFSGTFPEDWYPNNCYSKTSWILFFTVLVHFASAVVTKASHWVARAGGGDALELQDYENGSFIPLNEMTTPEEPEDEGETEESLRRNKNGPVLKRRRDNFLSRLLGGRFVQKVARNFGSTFEFIYTSLNYPLFLYLLIDCCIGLAVGCLFGKGKRIFNLLAHWTKGGVFFIIGIVSLARYCGVGRGHGWAWNKVVIKRDPLRARSSRWAKLFRPRGTITMEGIESFLVFFYGSTNVFLEHLAGRGGAWTPKDLQHVSIAFMYIGTGLCGLLTECSLNKWKFEHVMQHSEGIDREEVEQASPGYSPNPFPTFTVFWTGILMSQHSQASETSRMIHMQWGYLLSYGAFFRLLTFVILFVVPNKDFEPSLPFTELIASFCLLCGGMVFMESTDQVVEALEYRGFTPMFSFNISVGVVALIMAWEMVLLFWRRSLERRQTTKL